MVECRTVLIAIAFVALCLFIIPIKISNVEEVEQRILFDTFVNTYNKSYGSKEEYESRFLTFKESLNRIKQLNEDKDNSLLSAPLYGITKYSDMNASDFASKYLLYDHKKNVHKRRRTSVIYHSNRLKRSISANLPRSVDWRSKGCVTAVKNQKTCGACWAFSTISTVESMLAIKTGKLSSLSTQEAIDCAQNGNMGCDGGDICTLLEWLVGNDIAIKKEEEYPLVLRTETCKLKQTSNLGGVHVASNFTCDYLVGDEDTILSLLAYHGPVAVAVNAFNWQFYIGGIIQFHCDGSLQNLNHAVQLVGYNLDSNPPYFIVKNSWGKTFGEKGYLRIAVGSNVCGIASEVAALDVLLDD